MSAKTTSLRFEPEPNDSIQLFKDTFVVQRHPGSPQMAFAAEGRRAIVYQLQDPRGERFALKVFKKKFRDPSLITASQHLKQVESFDGVRAARRRVVLPDHLAAHTYRNLTYAMLMPWIAGKTWFDILLGAQEAKYCLRQSTAVHLCARLLKVMDSLESAGIAHTDISAGNVMIETDKLDVQLLDLEDFYFPGAAAPTQQNAGSFGYRHPSSDHGKTFWCAEGDRYATAVLAAEILILANRNLARKATDNGYFANHHRSLQGSAQYEAAKDWIATLAPEFAKIFDRSWQADTLEQCPSISELHASIDAVARRTPIENLPGLVLATGPLQGPDTKEPTLASRKPQRYRDSSPVDWVPLGAGSVVWIGGVATSASSRPSEAAPLQLESTAKPAAKAATSFSKIGWLVAAIILLIILIIISRS